MHLRKTTSRLSKFAAAAAVATLALTGCAGGSSDAADGPVTLRYTWWGSDVRHKITQQLIDAFEAENPGIQVEGEYSEASGYWDKLATQIAARKAPDVIQMDALYLSEYAERGALLELNDVDLSKFDSAAVDAGKVDGKQYAAASGINALVFLANPSLLDRTGVTLPDDSTWTWDEFEKTAAAVTANGNGVYGSGPISGEAPFSLWLRQHGKSVFTADGELGFNEDDATKFFQMQADLRDAAAVPPASIMAEEATAALDQSGMATNKFAFGWAWSNQLGALTKASGEPLQIRRPPSVEGNSKAAQQYFKASQFWSINSKTKHPEEAQKFIDFLANSEAAGQIAQADRGIPANSDVRSAVTPKLSEADAATAKFIDDIADEVGSAPAVPPAGSSPVNEIIIRYVTEINFSRLSPQEAAKKSIEEIKSTLT